MKVEGLNVALPKVEGAPRARDMKVGSDRVQELWAQMKAEAADHIAGFIRATYGSSPKVSDVVTSLKLSPEDKNPELGSLGWLRRAALALVAGDEGLFTALRDKLAEQKLELAIELEKSVMANDRRLDQAAEDDRLLSVAEQLEFDRDMAELKAKVTGMTVVNALIGEAKAAAASGEFETIDAELSLLTGLVAEGQVSPAIASTLSEVSVLVSEAKAVHRELQLAQKAQEQAEQDADQ